MRCSRWFFLTLLAFGASACALEVGREEDVATDEQPLDVESSAQARPLRTGERLIVDRAKPTPDPWSGAVDDARKPTPDPWHPDPTANSNRSGASDDPGPSGAERSGQPGGGATQPAR